MRCATIATVRPRLQLFPEVVGFTAVLSKCWAFLSLMFAMDVRVSSAKLMYLSMMQSLFIAVTYVAALLLFRSTTLNFNVLASAVAEILLPVCALVVRGGLGSSENIPRVA